LDPIGVLMTGTISRPGTKSNKSLTGGTDGPANTLFGGLLLSVLDNGMHVVGIDRYFQQSILGAMIIISVMLTFDRSKTPVIK
jgi:ribose transport system permease protein